MIKRTLTEKRGHPRVIKRLTVNFVTGSERFMGITSDISHSGLFIRTSKGFIPGTAIDIELILPDNRLSILKGIVRRTVKTPISSMKNGMGVEILVKDGVFENFLKSVCGKMEIPAVQGCKIASCSESGRENEIPGHVREERRKHRRFKAEKKNLYGNISPHQDVEIINISMGGILVKTEKRLDINNDYLFKLSHKCTVLTFKARALWSLIIESKRNRHGEIVPVYIGGLQFSNISRDMADRLREIIEGDDMIDYV
ncbi:MAG: PilZ domain-containing protein [Nitrospirota bacterium]